MADDIDYKKLMPPRCGAKKRNGEACMGAAMRNGRCRLHGGKSPGVKGNTNRMTHGFYYNALSDDEKPEYEAALKQGSGAATLEHELAMMRVKLTRLLRAARDAGNDDISDRVERHVDIIMKSGLSPSSEDLGGYDKKELKTSLPHLGSLIVQAVETIRKLSLSIAQLKVTERDLKQGEEDKSDIAITFTRLTKKPLIDTES